MIPDTAAGWAIAVAAYLSPSLIVLGAAVIVVRRDARARARRNRLMDLHIERHARCLVTEVENHLRERAES